MKHSALLELFYKLTVLISVGLHIVCYVLDQHELRDVATILKLLNFFLIMIIAGLCLLRWKEQKQQIQDSDAKDETDST